MLLPLRKKLKLALECFDELGKSLVKFVKKPLIRSFSILSAIAIASLEALIRATGLVNYIFEASG